MSKYYIPVINIDKIAVNGNIVPQRSDYKLVGNELVEAFKNVGFVYLKNHGIPENLINETHEVSSKFFNLPIETKEKYSKQATSKKISHGFIAINREKLASVAALSEIRESYDVKYLDGKFPDEECKELQPKVAQLSQYGMKLCFRILEALEVALDLEPGTLLQQHTQDFLGTGSLMRLLHYPPISEEIKEGSVRCGTHSDYGTFTLLFQDNMGGLEVLARSGEWRAATPINGTILVNVGDLLQRWTSDRFIATKHRVLVPKDEVRLRKPRSSIVLFFHPNNGAIVQPLDGLSKYLPITAEQYLLNRYSATYQY